MDSKEKIGFTNSIVEYIRQGMARDSEKTQEYVKRTVSVLKAAMKKLKRFPQGTTRAVAVHKAIDEVVREHKYALPVSCKKGCAHCCYVHVSITKSEGDLIMNLVKHGHAKLDVEQLKKQRGVDEDGFFKLSHEDRRCVFLAQDNSCSIYDHRPTMCRKYLVVSPPEKCDLRNGSQPVATVMNHRAEIIASAALNLEDQDQVHSMADVLLQKLEAQSASEKTV